MTTTPSERPLIIADDHRQYDFCARFIFELSPTREARCIRDEWMLCGIKRPGTVYTYGSLQLPATRRVMDAARRIGFELVHISTDYSRWDPRSDIYVGHNIARAAERARCICSARPDLCALHGR